MKKLKPGDLYNKSANVKHKSFFQSAKDFISPKKAYAQVQLIESLLKNPLYGGNPIARESLQGDLKSEYSLQALANSMEASVNKLYSNPDTSEGVSNSTPSLSARQRLVNLRDTLQAQIDSQENYKPFGAPSSQPSQSNPPTNFPASQPPKYGTDPLNSGSTSGGRGAMDSYLPGWEVLNPNYKQKIKHKKNKMKHKTKKKTMYSWGSDLIDNNEVLNRIAKSSNSNWRSPSGKRRLSTNAEEPAGQSGIYDEQSPGNWVRTGTQDKNTGEAVGGLGKTSSKNNMAMSTPKTIKGKKAKTKKKLTAVKHGKLRSAEAVVRSEQNASHQFTKNKRKPGDLFNAHVAKMKKKSMFGGKKPSLIAGNSPAMYKKKLQFQMPQRHIRPQSGIGSANPNGRGVLGMPLKKRK